MGKKHYNSKYCNILAKSFLVQEYTKNKKSVYKIAEVVICSPMTIWNYLNKYNIKRRNQTENYSGEGNPNFGKRHPGMNKGQIVTKETRIKQSLAKQGMYDGRKNPHFGKPVRPKWGIYNGIKMRSNWEILYAKYLDSKRIEYQYEPKTFDLGNITYTPDFYLPKTKQYIEIKGYFPDKIKRKIKLFRQIYSKENFKLLQGKELGELGIPIEERFCK